MGFSEWKEYKLSELMTIIGGGTPKTSVDKYWNGEIPWLSVKDFNSDNRIVNSTEKTITKLGLENSSTKVLDKGDLIISARGTVGALAQLGKPMAFNQSCYGLRANNLTTNDFLYYLLKHKIKLIQQNTHGSVFDTITRDIFDTLKAEIPISLQEQKSISYMLATLDDKIEISSQINKNLRSLSKLLFKHWFVDFEFPNEEELSYKSSGGEMVYSELGMIPKGWRVTKISDLDVIVSDYVANGSFASLKENVTLYDTKEFALFMRNTDLKVDFISSRKYVDKHSYDFLEKSRLFGGEVIISNVGDVGSVYLCPKYEFPMTLGNNVIMLKTKDNVINHNLYLYNFFTSMIGQGVIDGITGGSAQPKFNKTDFRNLKLIFPDDITLAKYNLIEDSIQNMIFNNKLEKEKLAEIRDTLLPKLMSGEIDLSNLQID